MADAVTDLLAYIDRSPTPYHAVAESVRRLRAAGFEELSEAELWELGPGECRYLVRSQSSLVAFRTGSTTPSWTRCTRPVSASTCRCSCIPPPPASTARRATPT